MRSTHAPSIFCIQPAILALIVPVTGQIPCSALRLGLNKLLIMSVSCCLALVPHLQPRPTSPSRTTSGADPQQQRARSTRRQQRRRSSGGAAAPSQEYGGAMRGQQLSQRHRLAGLDVPGTSAAGSEGAHRCECGLWSVQRCSACRKSCAVVSVTGLALLLLRFPRNQPAFISKNGCPFTACLSCLVMSYLRV
jgi:hypothetical protein